MKKVFTLFALAAMALAAQANVMTVCDGTETNGNAPISGFNYDLRNTMTQMIYPADMLTGMVNGEITEVRFYATAGFDLGQNNIQLSFMQVDQDGFDEATPVTGTAAVAYGSTITGETELVFTLDQPYQYTGGNLLIETLLLSPGKFKTTNFYGIITDYAATYYQYQFNWGTPFPHVESFLPKVTFTFEGAAPVATQAPGVETWTGVDGDHTYYVQYTAPEDDCEMEYRYQFNDEDWTQWMPYDDVLAFTEDGNYVVECRAQAPGKEWSEPAEAKFAVTPRTALDEINGGKTVATVRYFNVAGQQLQQPQGLTIQVTTYSDGTITTAKVLK